MRGVFVTGTDTGAGKTLVATALLHALRTHGVLAAGFKPVAAGAELRDGRLVNEDALALREASGLALPYAEVNPYCFEPPVAPHIAAAEAGCRVAIAALRAAAQRLAGQADFLVVEGAGGWRVPLGPDLDMQGLAGALELPVLLVVGLRLGCLNHALLTADAIRASGQVLLGWVGSAVEAQMPHREENIVTLRERLDAPCLGVIPHLRTVDAQTVAARLDVGPLLGC